MLNFMTISQFALAAGVGVETVRYYHRCGLLPLPKNTKGAYRQYNNILLEQLRFIRRTQSAGFSLKEIKVLLHYDPVHQRQDIQKMARHKIEQLVIHIQELQQIKDELLQLVHHCESSDPKLPCPIIKEFAR